MNARAESSDSCRSRLKRDSTETKNPLTILIDTAEQAPLSMPRGVLSERANLMTGDYTIKGHERLFAVERKSLQDLVKTIIHERERFEYELLRLTHYQFRRVLVEASYEAVAEVEGYDFSLAKPKSVIASVHAFEARYDVPFIFAGNRNRAARMLCSWAYYFHREALTPKAW